MDALDPRHPAETPPPRNSSALLQLTELARHLEQLGAVGLADSDATEVELAMLSRLGRQAEVAQLVRRLSGPAGHQVHPGAELSERELDVVRRLIHGDRVPAIAEALFLSQSTVRNHLASVFRKLGVRSQQGLLDELRRPLTEAAHR